MLESDLRTALGTAVEAEPPVDRGPDAVFAAARRIGVRRQVGGVLVGLTTIALVLSVGLVAHGSGAGSGSGRGHGVAEPGTIPAPALSLAPSPVSAAPTPSGGGGRAVFSSGGATVDNRPDPAMLAKLKSLLPAGLTTSDGQSQVGYAGLVVGDAKGKVRLEINVQPDFDRVGKGDTTPPSVQVFDCAWRESDPVGTVCHLSTLANGTRVLETDGPNQDARSRSRERDVDTITVGDLRIAISQWNAVVDKTGPVTRPTMLLSADQMISIALNPIWQDEG